MKLGDYLQALHSYIGMDVDNQDYIVYLIPLIMREPENEKEIKANAEHAYYPYSGEISEKDFLGRIYNGRKLPKNKARMIKAKYEPSAFKSELEASNLAGLSRDLASLGVSCTESNVVSIAEELMHLFIDAAVMGIEEVNPSVVGQIPEAVIPVYDDTVLKNKFGVSLLHEVNQHCPNAGCFKPLYQEDQAGSAFDYNIVQINPKLDGDTRDNLIALCPECARKYNFHLTQEKIDEMEGIKLKISLLAETSDKLSQAKIVDGVGRVIHKIADIPLEKVMQLNYTPTRVINKMDKTDASLYLKIHNAVSGYYPDIEALFKQEQAEGNFN